MTRTSKMRLGYWVCAILSFLCWVAPPAYFIILAAVQSSVVFEKMALCATVLVVLLMTAYAAINKIVLRSRIWVLLIGLYFVLDTFMLPLFVIASCQIVDEMILTPLKNYYKVRYITNKEMDLRGG